MGKWSSCGFEFDTKPEKFGELRSSNDILEDGQALRHRMKQDGYLLLREVLDQNTVIEARRELVEKLDSIGDIDHNYPLIDAILNLESNNKPMSATGFAKKLGAGRAIRTLVHQGKILEFYRRFFGKEVRPLDFVWVR
ncbi:MAG: hypothetical protein NZ961_19075, partial [Candidatus Poribacteria bacterium]|nr:hypothetical protein [Candidatus Poribacteria bacterium]